ncbi:MocE family 2Fe-2S type ferredoxin [Paenibacillus sp. OV219]|uniref:MocE family 2Fe-2S type ferredoxin n=1 Tax=Paenibacillus sp. OV219 TaxID=1884377 RepID=UPI0008AF6017|nr:MocE family 2Fe-2S type ferredoxin [Paenibacillus sp. OV219]SEO89275.1 3-phenylpropionate/trans-cinnamate dioxygenase ferredoxin subunit [Paenibacillus sp. OV219]
MTTTSNWIEVCSLDDVEQEDVIRFDYGDRTFAIYRTDRDICYATDGHCSHEKVHLADGLVMGNVIECPKHNGRFDISTGAPMRKPACKSLITYPVKVEDGKIHLQLN